MEVHCLSVGTVHSRRSDAVATLQHLMLLEPPPIISFCIPTNPQPNLFQQTHHTSWASLLLYELAV